MKQMKTIDELIQEEQHKFREIFQKSIDGIKQYIALYSAIQRDLCDQQISDYKINTYLCLKITNQKYKNAKY